MPSRRRHEAVRAIVCVLLAACALIACVDTLVPTVREVTVPVDGLARPLSILQVSDLHSARFGARQRRLAELLGTRRFDAVVLTGDLQNGPDDVTGPALELLEVLRRRTDLVVFVQGNHDGPVLASRLRAAGALELDRRDTAVAIGPARGGALLMSTEDTAPLSATTAGDGPAALVIVSHVPPAPASLGVRSTGAPMRVYLAGHTHGGQLRLPLIGALWTPAPQPAASADGTRTPTTTDATTVSSALRALRLGEVLPDLRGFFVRGLALRDGAAVNVSAGLGTFRLPLRFLDRAGVDVIHLVPAGGPTT